MDDTWNIPMGIILPRRRSTEESRRSTWTGGNGLDPNDFHDVFGGPPRTVLLRRFSGEFALERAKRPESIYEEIFRSSERGMSASGGNRSLPGFRIPPAAEGRVRTKLGFYDDIFGSDGGKWKSKFQSMEKSKLSDLSPARHCAGDDAMFSTFASKLRPITIPDRRYNSSPPSTFSTVEASDSHYGATNHPRLPSRSCFIGNTKMLPQHSHSNFSYCFSPPETIRLKPSFSENQKKHVNGGFFDSSDVGSPSSVISSVFLETMGAFGFKAYAHPPSCEREVEKMVMEVEERAVAESPFVIEIESHGTTDTNESAAAVDEAIAWAKEKFFSHVSSTGLKSTEKAQPDQKQMELEEGRD